MLRPRNGTSPEGDSPHEPDTPNSHYSPTMPASQGGSGVPGDMSPLDGAFDEKTGTQVHGLGLASRRGSKPPTLSLGTDSNALFARATGKGKGAKLGAIAILAAAGCGTDGQVCHNALGWSSVSCSP